MELRHLRYFIAVAEAGSLTVAAEQRLHTAQPSLSRQIRALEQAVGVPLLTRGVRGIALTDAGKVFLDHARLTLAQVDAAVLAARRAATHAKPRFALGFLTGQEMDWLPAAMALLKDELARIEVTVSSQYSPLLGEALRLGTLDLAFMRPEPGMPDLEYRLVTQEPLVVALPSDHALTKRTHIALRDLASETFIGMSATAPSLRAVIDDYLKRSGVPLQAAHEVDNLGMAMSLIASTRGVALLPAYAENFLPWSVASRPLAGEAPTIDLVMGYNKANRSPILERFLSRSDALKAHGARRPALPSGDHPVRVHRT
ncbi:MAG: LysR family transcriptional regulator [Alphaproteobacteria bacterium]|nr:LysR family transcriptional regulator [Alphaproteobacteria bacterium]